MPVIIELTTKNGNKIYVNASKILQFTRVPEAKTTRIFFDMAWDDSSIHVQEMPEEIMVKIGKASEISTETTIYTDDRFTPHFYTD